MELKATNDLFTGSTTDALNMFKRAFQLDSNSLYSAYCLADLYRIKEHYDSALIFIDRAIEIKENIKHSIDFNNDFTVDLDVKKSELYFLRGMIRYELKQFQIAKNDFRRVYD
jgi:tetratricopeptide (TPR) repeat protein